MASSKQYSKRIPHSAKRQKRDAKRQPAAKVSDRNDPVHFDFSFFDDYRWKRPVNHQDCFNFIAYKLRGFSNQIWKQIGEQKKEHHNIEVHRLSSEAQKRFREIQTSKWIDVEELFSFKLAARQRIFGIKQGKTVFVLWWDPDHQVYPSKKQ